MSSVQNNNDGQRRNSAPHGNDSDNRDWELDPEKPWQTVDFDERVERAKEQARERDRIKPNYGKAEWSRE